MSSDSPHTISIQTETIELCQALKLEGLASSGGEAKVVIGNEQVQVNGETETRKRRKIGHGDSITFQGVTYQITGPNA